MLLKTLLLVLVLPRNETFKRENRITFLYVMNTTRIGIPIAIGSTSASVTQYLSYIVLERPRLKKQKPTWILSVSKSLILHHLIISKSPNQLVIFFTVSLE